MIIVIDLAELYLKDIIVKQGAFNYIIIYKISLFINDFYF